MSAEPVEMEDMDRLDVESENGSLAPRDTSGRAMHCAGCGQRRQDITALEAITVIGLIRRRCASLLRQHQDSLGRGGLEPGSWSAMHPVAHVSAVLASVNGHIRALFGEETRTEIPAMAVSTTPSAVHAGLVDNVRRLATTIGGATTEDWYRARPDSGATASQLVWHALHDAIHHVERAEVVVDAALAARPVASPAAAGA